MGADARAWRELKAEDEAYILRKLIQQHKLNFKKKTKAAQIKENSNKGSNKIIIKIIKPTSSSTLD